MAKIHVHDFICSLAKKLDRRLGDSYFLRLALSLPDQFDRECEAAELIPLAHDALYGMARAGAFNRNLFQECRATPSSIADLFFNLATSACGGQSMAHVKLCTTAQYNVRTAFVLFCRSTALDHGIFLSQLEEFDSRQESCAEDTLRRIAGTSDPEEVAELLRYAAFMREPNHVVCVGSILECIPKDQRADIIQHLMKLLLATPEAQYAEILEMLRRSRASQQTENAAH